MIGRNRAAEQDVIEATLRPDRFAEVSGANLIER
jgi:hypothetical protein